MSKDVLRTRAGQTQLARIALNGYITSDDAAELHIQCIFNAAVACPPTESGPGGSAGGFGGQEQPASTNPATGTVTLPASSVGEFVFGSCSDQPAVVAFLTVPSRYVTPPRRCQDDGVWFAEFDGVIVGPPPGRRAAVISPSAAGRDSSRGSNSCRQVRPYPGSLSWSLPHRLCPGWRPPADASRARPTTLTPLLITATRWCSTWGPGMLPPAWGNRVPHRPRPGTRWLPTCESRPVPLSASFKWRLSFQAPGGRPVDVTSQLTGAAASRDAFCRLGRGNLFGHRHRQHYTSAPRGGEHTVQIRAELAVLVGDSLYLLRGASTYNTDVKAANPAPSLEVKVLANTPGQFTLAWPHDHAQFFSTSLFYWDQQRAFYVQAEFPRPASSSAALPG